MKLKELSKDELVKLLKLKQIIRTELTKYHCPDDCAKHRDCVGCAELQSEAQNIAQIIYDNRYRKLDDMPILTSNAINGIKVPPREIFAGSVCGACCHNDGNVYTSNPPKFKCTITGEFHSGFYKCDVRCVVKTMNDNSKSER